jgi:diketogulonate reductase-like aldo/keto reductase
MEKLQRSGKARAIGISNFSKQETTRILDKCTIVPAAHQLELHPWLQQTSFVDFLKSKGIHVTQYSSLGNQNEVYGGREKIGRLVDDESLVNIGKKYGKSGAQIALGEFGSHAALPPSIIHTNGR